MTADNGERTPTTAERMYADPDVAREVEKIKKQKLRRGEEEIKELIATSKFKEIYSQMNKRKYSKNQGV